MTPKALRAVGAALFSVASALAAQAPPPAPPPVVPLTLQQAVARALAANPTLQSARQHVSAVDANKITAGLRQNPTLTLYGQGIKLPETPNQPDGNPFFYSANVSRLFERGNKRGLRLDAANATAESTQSLYHDQQRQLVLAVRAAFTNMLLAKASLAVAQENLTDYRKTVALSRDRLNAGDITQTDFDRIDLQQVQFESDADNAQLNLQQASAQLQLLFGVDRPTGTLDVQGTLDPPQLPITMTEAEDKGLASRPDYLATRQALTAARGRTPSSPSPTARPIRRWERSMTATVSTTASASAWTFLCASSTVTRARRNARVTRSSPAASPSPQPATRSYPTSTRRGWPRHRAAPGPALQQPLPRRGRDTFATTCSSAIATATPPCSTISLPCATIAPSGSRSLTANAQVWLAIHQLSFATATDIIP